MIKSPNDIIPAKAPTSKTGAAITNGEPGYEKRSSTSTGVPEVTYDRAGSKALDIKSPAGTPISMPKD